MVQIAGLISHQQREKLIVPIILDCIKDSEDEERRMMGVSLLDDLAEILG